MGTDLNRKLGFGEEEISGCVRRGGLLSLELEFTRECNLRCVYCYSSAGNALQGEMSYEQVLDVIRQAKVLGAKRIILLGGGEPLRFPRWRQVVDEIRSLGLSQVLFTNGILLTPETSRFLFDNRVDVVAKHNSFVPSVQDSLAGVPGAHGGIQRGLRFLREAGYPGDGRLLGIQSIVCRQNRDEIELMWRWARDLGITPYFEVPTRQGRAASNPHLELTPEEVRDVFGRLSEIDASQYGVHWEPRPPIAAFTCRRHLYSCLVNSRGIVQPCTGIDLRVGNVLETPLAEILRESAVIRDLRSVFERIDPACRGCPLNGDCYGCRGNAFQITGDYLAPDPSCWHVQRESAKTRV